jgi:hypothetical protein
MRFIFVILFASLLNPISLHANEQDLMASALKLQKTITPELSAKDKLVRYELVISKIDQIISDYGSSEIGLELLATDSIGNLNITDFKNSYLNELLEYYDLICATSPSYACLGFVSLSSANKICKSARNLEGFTKASASLINALRIFNSQYDDEKYQNIAIDTYRSCMKDAPNDFTRDYLYSQLLEIMMEAGDESKVRGIIEQMKTPFFKFNAVLSLRSFKNQSFDNDFVSRMIKYKNEKIVDKGDQFLAIMSLKLIRSKHFIKNGFPEDYIQPIDFYDHRLFGGGSPSQGKSGSLTRCGTFTHLYALDLYKENLLTDISIGWKGSSRYNDSKRYSFPGCGLDNSAMNMIQYLTKEGRVEDANLVYEFLLSDPNFYIDWFWGSKVDTKKTEEKFDIFWIDNFVKTEDDISSAEKRWIQNPKSMTVQYRLFKKFIDLGNVCEGSTRLFKVLKPTQFYEEAIAYFVSNPSVDPNKKYNCGDEDLELLLN